MKKPAQKGLANRRKRVLRRRPRQFREGVIEVWRKWLARRGDPKGMSWERMHKLLKSSRHPGRPSIAPKLRALIRQMSREKRL